VRRVLGLRTRIILALVAVTAVALGGAAVALFLPLERRLRHDALSNLAVSASAASDEIARLPRAAIRPQSPELEAIARSLRREGIQARLVDAHGVELIARDPDERGIAVERLETLMRGGRPVREVVGSGSGADAVVAERTRTHAGPLVLGVRRSLTDVESARTTFRRGFERAAVISLLIALLLGSVLTSRLVRRIRGLRAVALRVAAQGPGEAVPRDRSRDEIGDLTRAFATMQQRLAAQEEARKAFVATASHELRTPIASLRLRLGLLSEDLGAEDARVDLADVREQVALADEQTARLAQLASDLLDLSRLDAEVPLRIEPVPLVSLCRATLAEFEVVPGARVELTVHGEEAGGSGHVAAGDPDKIAQIVRILIDNARRHAPAGTGVRVVVEDATIAVEDDGPGVDPGERELIFERFRRGRGPDRHPGFGLGLAIGHELATLMGGDLRLVRLADPCRFELELPAAVEEPRARPEAPER
jgi:signal transduction histidine kinase